MIGPFERAPGDWAIQVEGLTFAAFTDAAIAEDFPRSILPHLDRWLDANVNGDTAREAVKARMLEFIADDTEYWTCQAWSHVYDQAKCWQVEEKFR